MICPEPDCIPEESIPVSVILSVTKYLEHCWPTAEVLAVMFSCRNIIFFVFFKMSLHNIGLRIHGGPEREATNSWSSFCQSLNRFSIFFVSLEDFLVIKLVIKNHTAPCVCCHTTLWNINVRKQAIDDKLQRTVATYLKCGGVVINQLKKGLLLSLSAKLFFFWNWWIFRDVQESGCLKHFVRLFATLLKMNKAHGTTTFLLETLPNIHRF